MTKENNAESSLQANGKGSGPAFLALAVIFVLMLCATFAVATSGLTQSVKYLGFFGIIILFIVLFWRFYQKYRPNVQVSRSSNDLAGAKRIGADIVFDPETEGRLQVLEEANEFFGASLKSSDMFRLVASRINEMVPFSACALLLADDSHTGLVIKYAVGDNAASLINLEIPLNRGLAGSVFTERQPRADEHLALDRVVILQKALKGFKSAIAAPLTRNSDVFGVLELFGNAEGQFNEDSLNLVSAISERFAPLYLSSTAFEKSISSALTDSLTNLPNERAFFLVLENQIAESQRFRDERPLTVLTIDIKSFSEINEKFGHAAGNDILSFSAGLIKNGLRRMDFLARSAGDEFLTVLPTASEEIGSEVIERLEQTFMDNPFALSPDLKVSIKLNFGSATFWKDGETPNQLLKTAYLRKQQSKTADTSKVIWFPKK